MNSKNNFKITKIGIIFLCTVLLTAFSVNASAQSGCLNICPSQGKLLNVLSEDPSVTNGVVCINNLTGNNHVLQNGAQLGNLPEAVYTCYSVSVNNMPVANFDIASATYSIGNIQAELDLALMDTEACGTVNPTAKTFDINSNYCIPCMLDVCLCNENASTDFVFDYTPSGDAGEELFIVVDTDDIVVAVSSGSTISAEGLVEGNYEIFAVIYDVAKAGSLPDLLSTGSALSDIESELNATACGTISSPINASVNADVCNCEPDPDPGFCATDVCPCNGEANEITLSTTGYTSDGNNEQWYIVVSADVIVTSQQAGTDGAVTFSDLPDGSHQVYAVNYDPVASPDIVTALASGNTWSGFTDGITNGTYCAGFTGPKEISVNDVLCECDDPPTCNNDAGVMPSQTLNTCYGGSVSTPTDGAVIDAGSVLTYVLHNGTGETIGNVIDSNTTGLFVNDGSFPTGVQLFICAVVSPDTGGFPDLGSDCTSISNNCTPVTFLSQIQIDVNVDCSQSSNYSVIFEVSGGTPASQPGSLYNASGDYTGAVAPGTPTTAGPFSAGTFYTLNINDANGCDASVVSQKILCEKLPIELISFNGEAQIQGNMLKWVTAAEIENDYFTLERSSDGVNFELINTQSGSGNTGSSNSYNYLDREAKNGISYYKLWQTDFDGTVNYIGVVSVTRGEASLAINNILPIPVPDYLELTYTSLENGYVELQVFNALGKELSRKKTSTITGSNREIIDVSMYPAGMYFLTIVQGKTTVTEKFIKE